MSATTFVRLRNPTSLHYALMASVAMHLCAFSMIVFWAPEMQTMVGKNPPVKIQVVLLEAKIPAPVVAKNPVAAQASRTSTIIKSATVSRPIAPPSIPVPAKTIPRIRNVHTEPSVNIKRLPQTLSAVAAQPISSEGFSKSRVSPLKTAMTPPAVSRSISFPTPPKGDFGSRATRQPVKLSPTKNLLSTSGSAIKTYAVAKPEKFHSKYLEPVSIQISNSLTLKETEPDSSARALATATYRPPTLAPLKMASISDLMPKPASIQEGEENDNELRRGYTRQIRHRIAQKKFYPAVARRRGFEGEPVVAFILNRDGSLEHLALDKTSGHKTLDRAALKAVKKGVPFPEIPEQLNLKRLKFKLPISFALE